MTTQAEQLVGARVTAADGKMAGIVEQVFRDDVDGTPAWARVRSGKTSRFVPLGSSTVTADGLSVPFDTEKILGGPEIEAGHHMSAEQATELSRYYQLTVPMQQPRGRGEGESGTGEQARSGQQVRGEETPETEADWLLRQEERIQVGKEMLETGRVRLHKYVDVEPVDQAIHLYHEEYDVERIPITAEERISGNIAEGEQELILHEERAVLRKEIVPVERVRLRARRVEEDATVHDELRRERIEIEPEQSYAGADHGQAGGQPGQGGAGRGR